MKQNRRKRKKQNLPTSKPVLTEVSRPMLRGEAGDALTVAVDEPFVSISLDEAEENSERTAQFLRAYILDNSGDPSTSSSSSAFTGSDFGLASSSNSSSGWSEGIEEPVNFKGNSKQKRLVAATGTVSTVIGKDYMKSSQRKEASKLNFIGKKVFAGDAEEAEQFLCAMLGEDTELGFGVVRDVLCKHLNILRVLCLWNCLLYDCLSFFLT